MKLLYMLGFTLIVVGGIIWAMGAGSTDSSDGMREVGENGKKTLIAGVCIVVVGFLFSIEVGQALLNLTPS